MHSVSKLLSCCVHVGAWIQGWKKDGFKPGGSPFYNMMIYHNQQTFNSRTHTSTKIFPATTLVQLQSQVFLFALVVNQSSEQNTATRWALISKITFKFEFLFQCSVQGLLMLDFFKWRICRLWSQAERNNGLSEGKYLLNNTHMLLPLSQHRWSSWFKHHRSSCTGFKRPGEAMACARGAGGDLEGCTCDLQTKNNG